MCLLYTIHFPYIVSQLPTVFDAKDLSRDTEQKQNTKRDTLLEVETSGHSHHLLVGASLFPTPYTKQELKVGPMFLRMQVIK